MRLLERFPMSAADRLDVVGPHDGAIEHDGLAPAQNLWRTTSAANCGKSKVERIRHLLRSIAMLDQPRWSDAARGDAAAAIAVAMDICDPDDGPSARFDLDVVEVEVEAEPVDLFRLMVEGVSGS